MHSRRFRASDPQRNAMGQSTEMPPLVSMLFWTFLNPLKFLMKIFNILVLIFFLFFPPNFGALLALDTGHLWVPVIHEDARRYLNL